MPKIEQRIEQEIHNIIAGIEQTIKNPESKNQQFVASQRGKIYGLKVACTIFKTHLSKRISFSDLLFGGKK